MKYLFFLIFLESFFCCFGQTGKYYKDGHGGRVFLPLGDLSFADTIISFTPGRPSAIASASVKEASLNQPDFNGEASGFLTLGCKGSLVLKFTDNALVDVEGPDLFVFELGKYIEATELSVSKDGKLWKRVGVIKGGQAAVDISDSVETQEKYEYIRLVDQGSDCSGMWPGADIDAVATVGGGILIKLEAGVLFDVNKSVLKNKAKTTLDSIAQNILALDSFQIIVEGHTDSTGSVAGNDKLSHQRASAVANYLATALHVPLTSFRTFGYGSKYPVATNSNEKLRSLNRRVELVVIPFARKR